MAATAAATSVFFPRLGQGFLEDLDLHRLAAEQPFEIANTVLELAKLRGADHRLVLAHRHRASFGHQTPPAEQQVRGDAVAPGHGRDGPAGCQALFHNAQLLLRRPIAASGNAGDHLDAGGSVIGHKHDPKHRLGPSMGTPSCPVEMGGSSPGKRSPGLECALGAGQIE